MIPSSTKNYLLNGAANGSRNVSLFDAACQMRDSGHDQNETQMALMPRALSDGLSVVELTKTIASVFGREAREPAKAQTRGQRKNSLRNRKPITYKTHPRASTRSRSVSCLSRLRTVLSGCCRKRSRRMRTCASSCRPWRTTIAVVLKAKARR